MKIIFFGTPDFVLPILDSLNKAFKDKSGENPIAAVVTQEPKPAGRKKLLTYSAVDNWAHKRNIPIFFKPADILTSGIKADLGVLAALGRIVPKEVIGYFPNGIINIHPSLLPLYRGASPIQASILSGDDTTGVTFIKLDKELDHGPIISQFEETISPQDTQETLREKLFNKSAEEIVTLIPHFISGKIRPKDQDHSLASFTSEITKQMGYIPWEDVSKVLSKTCGKSEELPVSFIKNKIFPLSGLSVERLIRAFTPWPGVWTLINLSPTDKDPKRLKILKAHLEKDDLILDEVQLEGKNPCSWNQFKSAYSIQN